MAITAYADVLTDHRVAEVLSTEYLLLAADRAALPNHPALLFGGDFTGMGALSRKIPLIGLMGYDLPAQVAEGASIVPQAVADQQISLSVARYGKAYAATDLVRYSDGLGIFNASKFAADAIVSQSAAMTNLIASLVGGFTRTAGASGVDLSIANILSAITELEIGSQASISPTGGQVMGVLHTQQAADFRSAWATSTSGGIQWLVKEADLAIRGNGYMGNMFGVDWFISGRVPTANAGADRAGGIFMRGGIVWGDAQVAPDGADEIAIGNKVLFGKVRDTLAATTTYASQFYIGATRGYDTAPHQFGVAIVTDA